MSQSFSTHLWNLKVRLQFTGWLQYIPTTIAGLIFALMALVSSLPSFSPLAYPLGLIATLLLAVLIFDILTVKFHIHPPERRLKRNDELEPFDLLKSRRSCRSFQARKLTPADHSELMESVMLRSKPSTSNRIGTSPIRFEYVSAPLTVWPVVGASEFLIAIAPKEYDRLAVIDVGRSLQKIVIDATRMGLATCWIGPGADQASAVQKLGERFDPKHDHVICVCAIGYKSKYKPIFLRVIQALQRKRLPISSLFFADANLNQPLNIDAPPFNHFGRTYEICQWSPSSFNGQTTRCVAVTEQKEKSEEDHPQLARFDFYATTQSRFYATVALGIWCANWEMGCEAVGISGRFAVLPLKEKNAEHPQCPRYDVSWVLDQPVEMHDGKTGVNG